MGKEYSKKEMKKILQKNVEIPESVDERIKKTYDMIGVSQEKSVKFHYVRRHRVCTAVAAIALLAAGMSLAVVAANKFLSVNWTDDGDKAGYDIQIDKSKEAHDVEFEAGYIPEGYQVNSASDDKKVTKWHNDTDNSSLMIACFNAAELDLMSQVNEDQFSKYKKDTKIQEVSVSGMTANLFISDGFYTNTDNAARNIYLFNEEYGYGLWISSYSTLSSDEIIKIAENIKIKVLDTKVPYTKADDKDKDSTDAYFNAKVAEYKAGVPANAIHQTGEEVKNPFYPIIVETSNSDYLNDIAYTVEQVDVKDALSFDKYPQENYPDYTSDVAPWTNEDETLKPHDRYRAPLNEDGNETGERILETAESKYVIVKMKAKNYSKTQSQLNKDQGILLAPDLSALYLKEDGSYRYPDCNFYSAEEGYLLQWRGPNTTIPVSIDSMYYTEGTERLHRAFYRPLAAGEEIEYTLVYVVDDDQLDNMYLNLFPGYGGYTDENGNLISSPYVKISN